METWRFVGMAAGCRAKVAVDAGSYASRWFGTALAKKREPELANDGGAS